MQGLIVLAALTFFLQFGQASPQTPGSPRGITRTGPVRLHRRRSAAPPPCVQFCESIWENVLLSMPESRPDCEKRVCGRPPGDRAFEVEAGMAGTAMVEMCSKRGVCHSTYFH